MNLLNGNKTPAKPAPGKGGGKKKCVTAAGPGDEGGEDDAGTPPGIRRLRI